MENQDLTFLITLSIAIVGILVVSFALLMWKFNQAQLKKQQEIYSAVINTQESEQSRIGKDLHDEVCPNLSAASLKLENILYNSIDNETTKEKLQDLNALLRNTNELVRNASHNLAVVQLKNGNNEVILEGYCNSMDSEKHSINLLVKSPDLNQIDPAKFAQIFRILKELVHNSIKHSAGTQTDLVVKVIDNSFIFNVIDNGRGIDLDKIKYEGLGLGSVKNRVSMLDGELSIKNNYPKGTNVELTFQKSKLVK